MANGNDDNILRTVLEVEDSGYKSELDQKYVRPSEDAARRIKEKIKQIGDGAKPQFGELYKKAFSDIEARADKARNSLSQFFKTQKESGNPFDRTAQSATVVAKRIDELVVKIRRLKAESAKGGDFDGYVAGIRKAERELNQLVAKQKALGIGGGKRAGIGSGIGSGIADGLNIPVTGRELGAYGAAAGAAIVATQMKAAFDATKEAANAQLLLNSTTKETGISYERLVKSAQKLGDVTLQSNRDAQKTQAQIATFANAAGRKDQVELFTKRFADLAAAKGIDPGDIGNIAKQLSALTDEATDRLLQANPSAFYDKYAKSIGKTAAALTDAEKRAAVFDEVLRRGALFDGTAQQKADAATSSLDRMNKKWEDAKEKIGGAVIPLVNFIEAATGFLGRGGMQAIFGTRDGTNPLLDMLNTSTGSKLGDFALLPITLPLRLVLNTVDGVTRSLADLITGNNLKREVELSVKYAAEWQKAREDAEYLRKTDKEIAEARKNPYGSFQNFALSQANLGKDANGNQITGVNPATTFFDPVKRKEALEKAKEDAQKFVDGLKTRMESAISSGDPVLLKFAQKEFRQFANLFDLETRNKIQESLAKGVSDGLAAGFKRRLDKGAKDVDELKKVLAEVRANPDLQAETRTELIEASQARLKTFAEGIKSARNEVREFMLQAATASSANPFVPLFAESESVIERFEKRFAVFGQRFAREMAGIEQERIKQEIAMARYQSESKALRFEQEARRLAATPETGRDQFGRRLTGVQTEAEFVREQAGLNRQVRDANFYATQFASGKTPDQFYGTDQLKETLETIEKLRRVSLQNTGVYGQGAVAEQVLGLLPENDVAGLVERARGFGAQADTARKLLGARAAALTDKRDLNQQKFQDFLGQQEFLQIGRKEAEERLAALRNSGLTDRQKNAEFLNLTGEIGVENLSPALLRGRIEALNEAAKYQRGDEKAALDELKKMSAVTDKLDKIITDKGLATYLSEQPLFNVSVNSKRVEVQTEKSKTATPQDVGDAMQINSWAGSLLNG